MQPYINLLNGDKRILFLTFTTWRSIFSVLTILGIFACTIIFFLVFGLTSRYSEEVIFIQKDAPSAFVTDKRFLSIALDTSVIAQGLNKLDIRSKKFIKMLMHLQPAYLRIGGTMADRLHFSPYGLDQFPFFVSNIPLDGGECSILGLCCACADKNNFTMTGSEWILLNKVAYNAGLKIIFDLNSLIRNPDGSWNSKNAETLISFSNHQQFNLNWELGNEPNAFRKQFNYPLNATQLAKDFKVLKSILNNYPLYKKSLLVGPDVTRPQMKHEESIKFLEKFLPNGKDTIDAITWHQYYFNGRTASANDFINADVFNMLRTEIGIVDAICEEAGVVDKPKWLGETSSAYGGGAPGLSDSFIAIFMWADKLGLAAKMGINVVVRQSIINGYYALIDDDFNPNPDWWYSVIYKHLVGNIVVHYNAATSVDTRLYVHCTPNNYPYRNGSTITIFGTNIGLTKSTIRIQGITFSTPIYQYELTTDSLFSKNIFLNEIQLTLSSTYNLPKFVANKIIGSQKLSIQPLSAVFWVIPNTDVLACQGF